MSEKVALVWTLLITLGLLLGLVIVATALGVVRHLRRQRQAAARRRRRSSRTGVDPEDEPELSGGLQRRIDPDEDDPDEDTRRF